MIKWLRCMSLLRAHLSPLSKFRAMLRLTDTNNCQTFYSNSDSPTLSDMKLGKKGLTIVIVYKLINIKYVNHYLFLLILHKTRN